MNTNEINSTREAFPSRVLIPDQVRLSPSIALGVVLQGLRIRLGRSIVTLTGIVCGIAFLMSIMTGQLIKKGVAVEDGHREEVDRMESFLRAELPPMSEKQVQIVGGGVLGEIEMRLIEKLVFDFGATVYFTPGISPASSRKIQGVQNTAAAKPALVIAMGDGPMPSYDWNAFFATGGGGHGRRDDSRLYLAAEGFIGERTTLRDVVESRRRR